MTDPIWEGTYRTQQRLISHHEDHIKHLKRSLVLVSLVCGCFAALLVATVILGC